MQSNIHRIIADDGKFLGYVVLSIRGGRDIVTTSRSVAGAIAHAEDDVFFRKLKACEVAEYEGDNAAFDDIKAFPVDAQPSGVNGTLMIFGDPPEGGYFALDIQGQMVTDGFLNPDEVIALMPAQWTP